MGLQQDGEFGLRRRLNMALEPDRNYAEVADVIGISAESLEDYLTDPDYQFSIDVYNGIIDNLAYLPIKQHVRAIGPNWRIVFVEKPLWTAGDVATLDTDIYATKAAVFIEAETYAEDIMTHGPDDLDTFTIQQVIDAAVSGDFRRLFTVVWYEPTAEFPYYPRT